MWTLTLPCRLDFPRWPWMCLATTDLPGNHCTASDPSYCPDLTRAPTLWLTPHSLTCYHGLTCQPAIRTWQPLAHPLLVRILSPTSLFTMLPQLFPGTARGLAQQPHGFPPELWPQLIPHNVQGLTGSRQNSNVAQESSFHPFLFSQGFTFSPYNEKGGRMQLLQTRLSNPVFT